MRAAQTIPTDRMRLGRIWIDVLTFHQALDQIERLVEAGQGGSVFTPNVDHVVNVESDEAFRQVYDQATLSLVDGMPLVWASHLLGMPLPEKISGSDLVLPLMERAAQRGWRVYLCGAAPGVADKAAEVLRTKLGVNVVGTDSPMISREPDPARDRPVLEKIIAAKPQLVLMAFGAPKQEMFIHRTAEQLRPAVLLGIGASLDFVAGTMKRSPRWMSKVGLEWAYRLAQEPGRLWRRYLINDPKFLLILLRTLREPRADRVTVRPR